jgi:acid phosphatase
VSLAALCIAATLAAPAPAAPPRPSKVVIVIEENHAFSQVIGSPNAPYINELAAAGMNFTNIYGITHPSQPNYLQFFSGSNQGVTNNNVPTGLPFTTPNLGAAIIAAGFTFVGYSEDLPGVGSNVASNGYYMRKHNPWVNWQNVPQGPNQLSPEVNRPFTDFPSDFNLLPDVSIVVPNQLHDMHDGTIAQGDAWLVANIKPFADWTMTHNGLLIIAFDEDNSASRNRIPTVFYGPMVLQGQSAATWTLHNLQRTIEDMYATTHSGVAQQARTVTSVFRSDPLVAVATFVQGVNGYAGAHETYIEQAAPDAPHGSDARIVVDGSPASQGLVRFEALVGPGNGQIPPGAKVLSAKLSLLTGPSSATGDSTVDFMALHRMLAPWADSDTWNTLVGGVSSDGSEAAPVPEFRLLPNVLNAWAIFDVTANVQEWADAAAPNYGWVVIPSGGDGWRWVSSDVGTVGDRPILEIVYELGPACPADYNHDGFVDGIDSDQFNNAFEAGSGAADFNGDGFVDGIDYDSFMNAFEAGC